MANSLRSSPTERYLRHLADASKGNGLANLTQGRIGDMRAPFRSIGFSGDGSEVWSAGTERRRLMLWPLIGGAPHHFLDDVQQRLLGHLTARGWCITRGNQATPRSWRISTATIHARLFKMTQDYTTTIRSGQGMGDGSSSYVAAQRREKWTYGVFRRTGERRNNLPISTLTLSIRPRSMSGRFCSWPTTKTGKGHGCGHSIPKPKLPVE